MLQPMEGCSTHWPGERTATVQSTASWHALWNEICAPLGNPPEIPPPPAIDFTNHTVLVALWGEKPSTSYDMRILSVLPQSTGSNVLVQRTAPGRYCGTFSAMTNPAIFAVVGKLNGEVAFAYQDRRTVCSESGPTGRVEAEAGPWRFQYPDQIVGTPGEPAHYQLDVRPRGPPVEGWLQPGSWTLVDGSAKDANVTVEGGIFDVAILAGVAGASGMSARFERTDLPPGDPNRRWGHAAIPGPDILLANASSVARVALSEARDARDLPKGLHVQVVGASVVATFSMGRLGPMDCSERASPVSFDAWSVSGRRLLVGFVATHTSDGCSGSALGMQPGHTPRALARTSPLRPGAIEVVVFTHHTCFCPPEGGWTEHRASVTIPV